MSTAVELIPVPDDETDQQIVDACVAGLSITRAAQKFGLSQYQINKALDRELPKVDGNYKRRTIALAAMRLDRLSEKFGKMAEDGDVEAGNLMIRIESERRQLLGLCGAGYDPTQLLQSTDQQASGTPAAYREVMLRLVKPKP